MTKEVSVTIEGIQLGTEEEPIISTASGTYHLHNDKHYIQYNETVEDGEGMIKSIIKISRTQIEMTKKGAITSQMTFDLCEMTEAIYQTPFGSLFFEVKTSKIQVEELPGRIEVGLEYSLSSNGELMSDNRTLIKIIPEV